MLACIVRLVGGLVLTLACLSAVAAQGPEARLRVVNAAPNSTTIDVLLDGKPLVTEVAFPTISDYLAVPAGNYQLAITPSGQGIDNAIITLAVTVDADKAYTIAAVGFQNVTAQVFTDDLTNLSQDKARVRVIHAVPDAPAADVQVVGGPTLIENLAFPNASKYIEVAPGTYNLQVVALGDTNAFLNLPNTKLEGGKIYDVVAVGRLANIAVAVAAVAPVTSGSAHPQEAQQSMPNTGIRSSSMLLLLSVCLLLSGAVLTRCSRSSRRPKHPNRS